MAERLHLFDTTLRDGAQTRGVDFSVSDKRKIALWLDDLGLDYVEGGWPGANPTDNAFFGDPPKLRHATFTAFGMTKRPGRSAGNDEGLQGLINSGAPAICIVGKSWTFHVEKALGITMEENLDLIADSIREIAAAGREPMLDAEHFFDGYKADPVFATKCLEVALEAGARWAVMCDTNGGTLPHEVSRIVSAVADRLPADRLGIHTHDDTGNAVANTLAAVRAGVRQVQGTLNGLGERCGNANIISLIPTLVEKMGFDCGLQPDALSSLTRVSRAFDEQLNRAPDTSAPYVGQRAFAHKGGLHASAVAKDPRAYEHIEPERVGNERVVVVSDQAGRSNVVFRLDQLGIEVDPKDPRVDGLVEEVKRREAEGYSYDGAEASFELLARNRLGQLPTFFRVERFTVSAERRYNARGTLVTESVAIVSVDVKGGEVETVHRSAKGPVDAIDQALRKALIPAYPELDKIRLMDYRVRILHAEDATAAVPRVIIESARAGEETDVDLHWRTLGVSPNIMEASFDALTDSYVYKLLKARQRGEDR